MQESIQLQRGGRKSTFLVFLVCYLFFLGLCFAGMASFRSIRLKQVITGMESQQKIELAMSKEAVLQELADVVSDIRFLATQTELTEYWQEQNVKTLNRIEQEYERFAQAKLRYDQVRLLDLSGKERIRVNFDEGRAVAVPRNELQDKSNRYYFQKSRDLRPGQVYISPLDLNVEKQQIEIPHKPMIRFGAVSYDEHEKPRGVVILNFKAAEILEMLRKGDESVVGEIQMVNKKGYWLRHPKEEYMWGWQLPGREGFRFEKMNPNTWKKMLADRSGSAIDAEGTGYQFKTISLQNIGDAYLSNMIIPMPYTRPPSPKTGEEWILMTTLPREVVAKMNAGLTRLLATYFGIAAVVLILPSWGLAQLGISWYRRRKELYRRAHFDKVTHLPNRSLFKDRLEQVHRQAVRYNRTYGVLFIDLDGFKAVNDRHGHDAGDELLCAIGKRLGECIRKSDTAARMGGDEFVVILSEIRNHEDAASVAEKILQAVSFPVELPDGHVRVGCSVGVAVYPDDGAETTELLFKSDAAMYRAKMRGKGQFCLSEDVRQHETAATSTQWRK